MKLSIFVLKQPVIISMSTKYESLRNIISKLDIQAMEGRRMIDELLNQPSLPGRKELTNAEKKKEQRTIKSKERRKSWKKYRKEVWELTEEQPFNRIGAIRKRGKDYHLDHKISIWYGWKNDLPKESIANIGNLRIIPAKENLIKGRNSVFDDNNSQLQIL